MRADGGAAGGHRAGFDLDLLDDAGQVYDRGTDRLSGNALGIAHTALSEGWRLQGHGGQ